MKLDKNVNTILMLFATLLVIGTAFYAYRIAINNNVADEYSVKINFEGARLSDRVYGEIYKDSEKHVNGIYETAYTIYITNIGETGLTNWKVELAAPAGTVVVETEGVENSQVTQDGVITFVPDYTLLNIDSGSYVYFYFTLRTKESFTPETVTFSGYRVWKSLDGVGGVFNFLLVGWAIVFVGFFVTKFNLKSYRQRQKNDVKIILQSMNTFISFIDAKDPYTRGHSKRVAMYAAEIAKRMGLSEDEVQNIYYAGLLHDAGKISIPDAVLNKPGKLTDDERKLIQNHTIAGGKMLKQMTSLRGIRETALYHHERFDGSGYPEGLSGESIPLYARIVGVADSYDAMSSNRVYRRHLNKDEIIEEIQKGSGSQFDPSIVRYMVDMINDGYVNVVKMETAENDDEKNDFHITESDIPGVYMGM